MAEMLRKAGGQRLIDTIRARTPCAPSIGCPGSLACEPPDFIDPRFTIWSRWRDAWMGTDLG
jgi:hypothetical protein